MVLSLASACFPFSTGSLQWQIRSDKKLTAQKIAFLNADLPSTKANQRPNIIILMADDLGKYEVSAYEGVNHIATPHIDQIGAEGVVFESAYVTSPTCAPSRAGILTGRLQNRYGFETQIMEFYPKNTPEYLIGKHLTNTGSFVLNTKPSYPREWQVHRQGIPQTEINLAELLKKYDYVTGITGKWHLGSSHKGVPWKRGFDHHYGFNGAFSWYTPKKSYPGIVNYEHQYFSAQFQWKTGRNADGAITEKGKTIKEEQYLTFAIRDRAIDFIEANRDTSFFLYCTFSAPHIPFQAPQAYYDKYAHIEDDNKRVYYAMISALDDAVGSIHQRLKDLGLEENTIIYFISDNGGATYTGATDNGPLKGGKLNQFEGGINVPFMMKWAGHVPAGLRYQHPVSSMDIFTTSVLNIDGGELPGDRVYDGKNLLPYLTNQIEGEPHPQLYWRADHVWAMRDGDFKLIMSVRDGWAELYNLKTDRSEQFNIKDQMPELFDKLYDMHQNWQEANLPEKPLWPRLMDYRCVINGVEYLFPV